VDTKDPPGRGKAGQVGRELAWEKLTRFEWSKSGAKRDRDANDDHSDLIRPNAGRLPGRNPPALRARVAAVGPARPQAAGRVAADLRLACRRVVEELIRRKAPRSQRCI
jgi:hypothetical protein